jgi:hypothetical protein
MSEQEEENLVKGTLKGEAEESRLCGIHSAEKLYYFYMLSM